MKFTRGEKIYILLTIALGIIILLLTLPNNSLHLQQKQWDIQSIDTMKYSRDKAREAGQKAYREEVTKQVESIADTGANYVAIGTPYDDEFVPVIQMWVRAARQKGLKIWFRGNFSGWEGWFGYSKIDRQAHVDKTYRFITTHPELFRDGDIFSSCPECENGGVKFQSGDPYAVAEYRKFLIAEYQTTKNAFASINKKVASNYYSMNADVARAVMDRETTAKLDGLVVVDHYVKDTTQLADDLRMIAEASGGDIVLGEVGAPIPDLHGPMTPQQQKEWLEELLPKLTQVERLKGMNYWVDKGGSTAIWQPNGTPKPAVSVLRKYYTKSY